MPKEKISVNLGVPYVYLPDRKACLCNNGVLFTLDEYAKGIDLKKEYERREKEDKLYDYNYAKSTGLLRKKRNSVDRKTEIQKVEEQKDLHSATEERGNAGVHGTNEELRLSHVHDRRVDLTEELRHSTSDRRNTNSSKSVLVICALLAFTSAISMYISTLHTATYLSDYVDIFSAWLMSASVTAYNGTAFEVSVLFKRKERFSMCFVFMFLWVLVTVFSMATTVSVFYDRFNFNEEKVAESNASLDSSRLAIELLQKKEADLRDAISFKKKDIEYRQEREYATTAVRIELAELEEELQKNLTEQQAVLQEVPEAVATENKRKESLFAFLGRLLHVEGGLLEFTMSTLSAIFVNLIAPLSLTAVTELVRKKEEELTK